MNTQEMLARKHYIIRMTLPIFLQMLLMQLISNADQIMLSRYSQDAVTAVGNANQLIWIMVIFLNVLATASIILITQYKGSEDTESEKKVYALSLAANAAVGAVIGSIFMIFAPQILALINVEQGAVFSCAVLYLRIISASMLLQSAVVCYGAFLRSNAMLRESLAISVIANLFNIAGNALSLYVFDFGLAGVAVSSCLSHVISLILSARVFSKNVGRIDFSSLRQLPRRELATMLRLGVPAAGESMSYQIAQIVIISFVNLLGAGVVNTKIYVGLIASFAYLYCNALANATQVAEGWMLGARRVDDADNRIIRSLRSGVAVTTALMVIVWLLSDELLGLFTTDAQVLQLGKTILLIDIALEIGRACNITLVRALQTAGDVRFPTMLGIASAWLVTVPLAYYLGIVLDMGLVGIWLAMAADECLRGGILLLRWRKGAWRSIELVRAACAA